MFSSRILVGVLLAFLAVSITALDSATVQEMEVKKLKKLEKLSEGGTKAIVLSDANYDDIAIEDPRPYVLFTLFSASAAQGCHKCPGAEEEFGVLAASYGMMEEKYDVPVYFAIAPFKDCTKSFRKHKLNSAPVAVFTPPTSESQGIDLLHLGDERSLKTESSSAEDFQKFVRAKIGFQVEIYRSPAARIAFGLIILTVLGLFSKTILVTLVPLMRRTNRVWMVLSMFIYFVSVSGSIFCIIRNSAPYGMDKKTRRPIIFSTDGRNQFVYEGLVIGWLNIATALAAIMMVRGPPKVISKLFAGKKNQRALYITTIVAFACFVFLYRFIVKLYMAKTPWYLMQSKFARSVVTPFF